MKRILLVDDDDGFRNILAHVLRSKGYEVTCVTNGGEAWSLLMDENMYENVFDHIISDNDMPVLSGVQLLRSLRIFKTTPFMLLSGLEQLPNGVKLADMCADFGAKFFLKGSFALEDLTRELL